MMTHFDDLKKKVSGLGLEEKVIFLYNEQEGGWLVPDEIVPDFFKIADALLLTSRVEGFGIPVIEGGLFKLPVFAANIAQFREVGGEDIFFFDLGANPRDAAQKILEVYKDLPVNRMSKKAIRNFSWPMIFKNEIEPLLGE